MLKGWRALALVGGVVGGMGCRDEAPPALTADPPSAPGDTNPSDARPSDARAHDASGRAPATSVDVAPGALAEQLAAPCPDRTPDDLPSAPRASLRLERVDFTALPGWADDRHADALVPLRRSCARLATLADDARVGVDAHSGTAKQWRGVCAEAARLADDDHAAARAFFERAFVPHQALTVPADGGAPAAVGKLTGYYVESLRASRTRQGPYQYPIYGRPRDLVMLDLERFIADAHGRKVWGQLDPARGIVEPFPTRAQIRAGALRGLGLELLWSDDRTDVLFAQIQGSAKVTLDDGTTTRLEFAGKNGRRYRGVGKLLRDLGEPPGTGTMPGIRAWLAAHPDRFDEIVDQNQAFVFFKESTADGAIGSQQVVLTPRRSVAVDRAFVAASTPMWLDGRAPTGPGGKVVPWRALVIAQDTGGGILGPVRADVYWGDDDAAGRIAGSMGGPGRIWLLLPKGTGS